MESAYISAIPQDPKCISVITETVLADSSDVETPSPVILGPQVSTVTPDSQVSHAVPEPQVPAVVPEPQVSVVAPEPKAHAATSIKDVENEVLNGIVSKTNVVVSTAPLSGAAKLKKMIFETDELIVCPGVYDGLSARIAIDTGFSAMYMTGAGTTASRLGQPDLAVAQLSDMKENAEIIANLEPFGPPLIADMDTGYGGPIVITQAVKQYIRAGVAGFHIEDQIQNKRCGHLQGKKVVDREEYYVRIRAAKAAKDAMHSDIALIARTDALQMLGYDECIARLRHARSLGADVGLLEGFTNKEQAAQAVKDLEGWPLLLNSVENGSSPLITVQEAKEMGFRIMIFSFASIGPAYLAIKQTFEKLKKSGYLGTPKNLTPLKLFEMCGLEDSIKIDTAAGGSSFLQAL